MPVTVCTVSDILKDPSGALLTGVTLTFERTGPLQGIDGDVLVSSQFTTDLEDVSTVTTHASTAAFSIDLYPGSYKVSYSGKRGLPASVAITVPTTATANLRDLVGQATVIDSTVAQRAAAARDAAQAWAESDTPPDPEDPTSRSAKTIAETLASLSDLEQLVTDAEAAQTSAELAETNAETARDAAFVNADVYASTAAGLSGTTEGDQFQVVTGNIVTRYRHDAGPTATSVATYAAASLLRLGGCVVLTQTNSDGRLIEASAEDANLFPATGYNTIFALQVAGDKTAGSAQVNLADFATLALNGKDGSAISDADVWLEGDWLFFYRDQTSFQFQIIDINRISAADLPYATDAEALAGTVEKPVKPANLLPLTRNRMKVAYDLQPPTSTRPVRVIMPETGRMIWSIRLADSDYHDGYERSYGDALHVELIDAKLGFSAHSASTEQVWAINAMWATLGGQDVTFANHVWDTLQGDGSAETGGSPSTFEWMESIGLNATAEATINAAGGTGIYHGKIDCTNTLLVVTGGVLNGASVSDGTDLATTLKAGDVLYCTQFDIQTTATMYADDGTTTVATCSNLLRASQATQILWLPSIAHAADAKVTFGYLAMLPFNGANRLQGNGAGATGVQTVATSGVFDFGEATQVVGWNTNQAGRALAFEINGGYAPMRIDGVQQTWNSDRALFVVYDSEKAKLYLSNFQNSTTGDDVSNLTFSTYVTYKAVRADGTF